MSHCVIQYDSLNDSVWHIVCESYYELVLFILMTQYKSYWSYFWSEQKWGTIYYILLGPTDSGACIPVTDNVMWIGIERSRNKLTIMGGSNRRSSEHDPFTIGLI